MTDQPTRHGYAIDVRDYGTYPDFAPLSEDEVMVLYDDAVTVFWEQADTVAREHGFDTIYSAGRSEGWCVPYPQPPDDFTELELEGWMRDHFRPFERDIDTLMEACREIFLQGAEEAQQAALREPVEAAYWAACDVITR